MTEQDGALSPLDEGGIMALVERGLQAIAHAADLSALKDARVSFTGDNSILAQANRAIGSLDKADKPTAGKLLGQAHGALNKALAQRQTELEELAEAAMLERETVDVTQPTLARLPVPATRSIC